MCDPVSLTVAAVGLTVAGGATTAYGQYQEGRAAQSYYNYQADQAEAEGRAAVEIGNQKSELALKQGRDQSKVIQDVASQDIKAQNEGAQKFASSQRAIMAANGVTGVTAENVATDTLRTEQLDAFNLRYNADVKSWEAVTQSKNASWSALTDAAYTDWAAKNQAVQYRYAGNNARATASRQVFNTLLGTAKSVAQIGMMSK